MKDYLIGKNAVIESGVSIGHVPGRKIALKTSIIGESPVIRSNTVIYTNVKIGDNFETGHNVIIREENEIGNNFCIWNNSCVDYGCNIGNDVKIHNNVYISQFTVIEDETFLAPGVITANDLCPICTKCMKGPVIKRGAKIGINSTILPHITIGEHSVIGAGSVVTKDVPPHSLAFGSPAKVIKEVIDIKCRFGICDSNYERAIEK